MNDMSKGAQNLLINCAALKPTETLLIISEDPKFGWYDAAAPNAIAKEAIKMGITPTRIYVGEPDNEPTPEIDAAIDAHDCTIYFARIGDQDRFGEIGPGKKSVMCYIRDIDMLSSSYGQTAYGASVAIKQAVNDIMLSARNIEITCPAGTKCWGSATDISRDLQVDVSVHRFPLGVPMPMEANNFSGRVAITHFLSPTGSKTYDPPSIKLDQTVFVDFTNGRIDDFSGNEIDVAHVKQQYAMVADKFGIDADFVHSWHAGIHPGCDYKYEAKDDPDRWSNTVFTNPRVLHFHTCGAYAPGEICWMIFDHTVCVDGVNLWEGGRLCLDNFPQTKACIINWPELVELCKNPAQRIGI